MHYGIYYGIEQKSQIPLVVIFPSLGRLLDLNHSIFPSNAILNMQKKGVHSLRRGVSLGILHILQIAVHSSEDFPDVSSSYLVFKDEGKVHRISVTVSTTIGHPSLHRIDESKRKCYIADDYTAIPSSETPTVVGNDENNCYQRCRLRAIAQQCNCTPYYFKPIRGIIILQVP